MSDEIMIVFADGGWIKFNINSRQVVECGDSYTEVVPSEEVFMAVEMSQFNKFKEFIGAEA